MAWYTGDTTYDTILLVAFGYAALVAIGAPLGKASYGVFASQKMKLNLQPQLGWFLMEIPATLSFLFFPSWATAGISRSRSSATSRATIITSRRTAPSAAAT